MKNIIALVIAIMLFGSTAAHAEKEGFLMPPEKAHKVEKRENDRGINAYNSGDSDKA